MIIIHNNYGLLTKQIHNLKESGIIKDVIDFNPILDQGYSNSFSIL